VRWPSGPPRRDRVVVEGGTHREQVLVRKDLTLRGTDDATVAPPSGDLGTLSGLRPLVGAGGAGVEVTVEGFTIDGEGSTPGRSTPASATSGPGAGSVT